MNAPTSSGTLRKKIFTSAKLSAVQFGSNIGLRLISTVVLTRLLAPEVYGVFAVVLLYRQLLEMLSDIGIRDVILTKEGDLDAPFLSTCWTVSILRGALIFLVSGLIALVIFWLQRQGVFPTESSYVDPVLPLAIFVLGVLALSQVSRRSTATSTKKTCFSDALLWELSWQMLFHSS